MAVTSTLGTGLKTQCTWFETNTTHTNVMHVRCMTTDINATSATVSTLALLKLVGYLNFLIHLCISRPAVPGLQNGKHTRHVAPAVPHVPQLRWLVQSQPMLLDKSQVLSSGVLHARCK